jgi:hypothetical protein
MQGWQSTFLGARAVPRELSRFELQTFFTYSHAEHELIGRRRGPTMKLGLALHIGFLRMSGCLLDAFSILPPVLLRHLATELGINTPDLASLRAPLRAWANALRPSTAGLPDARVSLDNGTSTSSPCAGAA